MIKQDPTKDDPVEFSSKLISSGDLEPLYSMIWIGRERGVFFDEAHLYRWLMAFWIYHNTYTACLLSKRKGKWFWREMERAATDNGQKYPRGETRRYMHGRKAETTVSYFAKVYPKPEKFFDRLLNKESYPAALHFVEAHYNFGAQWKYRIVDTAERVLGTSSLDLSKREHYLDMQTMRGATALCEWSGEDHFEDDEDKVDFAFDLLADELRHLTPQLPGHARPLGAPEFEIALRKWRQYLLGTYYVGKDISAQEKLLKARPDCTMFRQLVSLVSTTKSL